MSVRDFFLQLFGVKDEGFDNTNDNWIDEGLGKPIRVMIEPDLNQGLVKNALKLIPNYFSFRVVKWDLHKIYELPFEGWNNFLMPTEDDSLVIFDGEVRGVQYGGGAYGDGAGPKKDRCGVSVFKDDNEFSIAIKTWHELLHTEGAPADDLMKDPEFLSWLPRKWRIMFRELSSGHDAYWQILYYTYLVERLLNDS